MSSIIEDILIQVKSTFDGSGIDQGTSKFNVFKAAAGAAITAAGAQMLNFSKTCVNSAIQAEAGWNSYTTALERVGGTAGRNIGEVKSEVTSLASTLGRATGDVRQAATDFMNYGVSANEAMKGASAVSAIAAAKNMDYASSEQIVMSALKGRGAQLKTLGIDIDNYKDATTGAIDTTRLFADIQSKYGDSQAKYSKSAAANQQRLTNSMNAFKTAVGTALVPILQAVTPLIVQFANALAGNQWLTGIVAVVISLGGALSVLSGPIMALQALFGSEIFMSFATKLKEIGSAAVQAGAKLAGMAKSGVETGLTTLKNTLSTVKTAAIDAGKALLDVGKKAVQAGASAAASAAKWLAQKAALIASRLATVAQTIATYAMTAAQTALNFVMSLNPITLVVMAIIALVAILVIAYYKVDWFRNGVNQLGQYLLQLAQTVYTVFSSIPGIIAGFIGSAVASAIAVGVGIYNGIMNYVNNIISGITSVFSNIASTISNFASTVYNSAISIGSNIVNGIIDGLGALGSWFSSLFGIGAGGPEAGLTYSGAGGPDAGATYTGNQNVNNIRTASNGNPSVSKTTNNQSKTVIANMTFDTRNLSTYEAKQVVIGALESL